MKLWSRAGLAVVAGFCLVMWVPLAVAQDRGSSRDLQTSCLVSDIPGLDQLSVTWTGDCVGGRASGVGNVFAFSRGELRYILRGQFSDGRLTRRDQVTPCVGEACRDQVAAAVLREHAVLARQRQPMESAPVAVVAPALQGKTEIRAADAIYRGNFVGDPQTGVVSGDGRVEFFDGRLFIGRLENGRKVGHCTYVWANGQRYVGDWRDDQQDGKGDWTSPQGDHYSGEYRMGKKQGKGVMTYANKLAYDGAWVADQPSGIGIFRYPNGDVYEGQVDAGEQTGRGTLTHQNGDRYTGQWLHGQREGKGLAEWTDRHRYEGDWRRDRKEGTGSMLFPDGGSYEGQWLDGRASGQGSVKFASGDSYTGEVLDGLPHGKGIYKWGSGDQFEGQFAAGKPTAIGTMTFQIDTTAKETAVVAPTVVADAVSVDPNSATVLSKATLCSRGYNAARSVSALRRFMESFPEDECARHALALQKIAVLEENERKAARELGERVAQAKALVGLVVAYRQEYSFCVSGSGASCQAVVYQFDVKGKIKEVDLTRQGVQVQVSDVALRGNEAGASAPLFSQGRAAATETFRKRMVGTMQWKTKTDVGLSF